MIIIAAIEAFPILTNSSSSAIPPSCEQFFKILKTFSKRSQFPVCEAFKQTFQNFYEILTGNAQLDEVNGLFRGCLHEPGLPG